MSAITVTSALKQTLVTSLTTVSRGVRTIDNVFVVTEELSAGAAEQARIYHAEQRAALEGRAKELGIDLSAL